MIQKTRNGDHYAHYEQRANQDKSQPYGACGKTTQNKKREGATCDYPGERKPQLQRYQRRHTETDCYDAGQQQQQSRRLASSVLLESGFEASRSTFRRRISSVSGITTSETSKNAE